MLENPLKSILIIDDNRDAADCLAILFKREGHRVVTAYDSDSGFALAQEATPDVIFHDIAMPFVDGYAAARRIRNVRNSQKRCLSR